MNWNKANGIKFFLDYIGISTLNTIAFGDGSNDVDMLNLVDTGVAMGNAVDELKKVATFITTDIFEDGIYNGLDKLKLI